MVTYFNTFVSKQALSQTMLVERVNAGVLTKRVEASGRVRTAVNHMLHSDLW